MERQSITFELDDVKNGPNSDVWTTDLIHQASYRENTLGLPSLCPEDNIHNIERDELLDYLASYYTPSRMVLAAVNVDHDHFVELAQRWFGTPYPAWSRRREDSVDHSLSQYTGGEVMVREVIWMPLIIFGGNISCEVKWEKIRGCQIVSGVEGVACKEFGGLRSFYCFVFSGGADRTSCGGTQPPSRSDSRGAGM